LAQIGEFDKLACEPCLTTRCVEAMTLIAIEQQLLARNLVLLERRNFWSGLIDSPFLVTRQMRHVEVCTNGLTFDYSTESGTHCHVRDDHGRRLQKNPGTDSRSDLLYLMFIV
jgi:hypothetical protein